MPTYFETVLNTTVTSIHPYPPPIIIKHHFWYFPNSDFFITICSIVYGDKNENDSALFNCNNRNTSFTKFVCKWGFLGSITNSNLLFSLLTNFCQSQIKKTNHKSLILVQRTLGISSPRDLRNLSTDGGGRKERVGENCLFFTIILWLVIQI